MTLDFNGDEGSMRFEFIYDGFVLGGSIERNKGMIALRNEIRILDKLESISVPYPCGKKLPNDEPKRKLNGGENFIDFTRDEINLIKRYMELVPWTTGTTVRNFVKVHDWIEASENQ